MCCRWRAPLGCVNRHLWPLSGLHIQRQTAALEAAITDSIARVGGEAVNHLPLQAGSLTKTHLGHDVVLVASSSFICLHLGRGAHVSQAS